MLLPGREGVICHTNLRPRLTCLAWLQYVAICHLSSSTCHHYCSPSSSSSSFLLLSSSPPLPRSYYETALCGSSPLLLHTSAGSSLGTSFPTTRQHYVAITHPYSSSLHNCFPPPYPPIPNFFIASSSYSCCCLGSYPSSSSCFSIPAPPTSLFNSTLFCIHSLPILQYFTTLTPAVSANILFLGHKLFHLISLVYIVTDFLIRCTIT